MTTTRLPLMSPWSLTVNSLNVDSSLSDAYLRRIKVCVRRQDISPLLRADERHQASKECFGREQIERSDGMSSVGRRPAGERRVYTANQPAEGDDGGSVSTAVRPPDPPSPARQRRRLTREELAPGAREAILRAAMQVVGEHGYANATIARVTRVAGIAQGTFYLYFESRQALLDELLPHCGCDLLEFVRNHVSGAKGIFEKEERGFRAFLTYMQVNPHFFRILTEAAGAAPEAHARHFEFVTSRYVDTLRRALEAGELENVEPSELETVAYMLMAMREYLYLRQLRRGESDQASLDEAVRMYMKFLKGGLRG